ncbi:MAG TPA: hypothetical protein VFC62_05990, partial [Atopostipes sp.]|nr:hypothetical protein [Atopostipes sp.]
NSKFYFEQAMEELMDENFEQAIEYFKKVYENDKSLEVNRLYSAALFTSERVDKALEIANDLKDTYISNEEMSVFYAMLLIKNHLFLEAEVLIQNYLSSPNSPFYNEWETIEKELEKEREIVRLELEKKIVECINELNGIQTYPLEKQSEIIANAHIVDLTDLKKVAKRIFIDSQIPSTTQKGLLELLIKKEDSQSYDFIWLDGLRKITPQELDIFEEVEVMEQLLVILESKLEKNPSIMESIWTEMINDLLVLYPFADEIITNEEFWVELYLQAFDLKGKNQYVKENLTKDEREMVKWQDYLNQLAQRTLE